MPNTDSFGNIVTIFWWLSFPFVWWIISGTGSLWRSTPFWVKSEIGLSFCWHVFTWSGFIFRLNLKIEDDDFSLSLTSREIQLDYQPLSSKYLSLCLLNKHHLYKKKSASSVRNEIPAGHVDFSAFLCSVCSVMAAGQSQPTGTYFNFSEECWHKLVRINSTILNMKTNSVLLSEGCGVTVEHNQVTCLASDVWAVAAVTLAFRFLGGIPRSTLFPDIRSREWNRWTDELYGLLNSPPQERKINVTEQISHQNDESLL